MALQHASWTGHARIKGYTKLQRMAMLTFSLIGLQQVFCAHSVRGASTDPKMQIYLGCRNDLYSSLSLSFPFPISSRSFPSYPSPASCVAEETSPNHIPRRLRTSSSEVGVGQEPDVARVDRSAAVGPDRAADCWRGVGFFGAEVGEEEAVHAAVLRLGGAVPRRARVGGGGCGVVCR